MRYRWLSKARPEQVTPAGKYSVWMVLGGRGVGKTRTGGEDALEFARLNPGSRQALVAATFSDGRDTMVEGESGLLNLCAPSMLRGGSVDSAWNRSLGELFLWNGSRFKIYSSERPRQLRGPQHHRAWCDELAAWKDAYLGDVEDTTWANLQLGLRLGADPRTVVTTTPKRRKLVRDLIGRPNVKVTYGSTYDNLANLAPTFREQVLERYKGTRLEAQEIHGVLLDEVEGALWTELLLAQTRVESAPPLRLKVVAVDPAFSEEETADEAGIVVAGVGQPPALNRQDAYLLADRTTRGGLVWPREAVKAYWEYECRALVCEANLGGKDFMRRTIHAIDPRVNVVTVNARVGKQTRAEPVAVLYDGNRVHHVGEFPLLEAEMTTWVPGDPSPNRLDALVWGIAHLMPEVNLRGASTSVPSGTLPGVGGRGGLRMAR